MPRGNRDYSQGKVYALYTKDDMQHFYIGSTAGPLIKRLCGHRSLSNRKPSIPVFVHVAEHGGWDNVGIELLKSVSCDTYEQLAAHEAAAIREHTGLTNQCIPGRTQKQWRDETKEERYAKYRARYKEDDEARQKILLRNRTWGHNHRDVKAACDMRYRLENEESVKAKANHKAWYENNRERTIARTGLYSKLHREELNEKRRQRRAAARAQGKKPN